jgi:hypothetical protein
MIKARLSDWHPHYSHSAGWGAFDRQKRAYPVSKISAVIFLFPVKLNPVCCKIRCFSPNIALDKI